MSAITVSDVDFYLPQSAVWQVSAWRSRARTQQKANEVS